MLRGLRKRLQLLPESEGRAKRYEPEERTKAIAIYEVYLARGMTAASAAERAGVPAKTLDRWIEGGRARARQEGAEEGRVAVNRAIEVLSGISDSDYAARCIAIFTFLSWRRWPLNICQISHHISLLLSTYLSQKYKARFLSDLPNDISSVFLRFIDIRSLAGLLNGETVFPQVFEIDDFEGVRRYTRRDLNAEIASFFLNSSKYGIKPTISKVYDVVDAMGFSRDFSMGANAFRAFWRENVMLMPFDYVEAYHYPQLAFDPDPERDDFYSSIDHLIENPGDVAGFLASSKWATNRFHQLLDRRAREAFWSPDFPKLLTPKAVPDVSLDDKIRAAIGTRTRRKPQ
ncbi:hypothetical protein NKJ71_09515 [Mesorhizobium sp. M0050]|uniref:hypothetical protein n=1 Tax=Mesorhizobium sp. M0050 TaxID=2956861 RepID=UPI00333AD5FE